jgi:hypothetical protein
MEWGGFVLLWGAIGLSMLSYAGNNSVHFDEEQQQQSVRQN